MFGCDTVLQLLVSLYRSVLENQIRTFATSNSYVERVLKGELEDPRTLNLFNSLQSYYKSLISSQQRSEGWEKRRQLKPETVHQLSSMFPKCMKSIFESLHQGRKIKHNERFHFSLFLKDLGMELEEAFVFWSTYYSNILSGNKFTMNNENK